MPDFRLYSSHTVWQSKAAFEAWTRSEEFRAAHKDAGQNKPLYIDHPQFEGFEVRQTVRRGEVASARAACSAAGNRRSSNCGACREGVEHDERPIQGRRRLLTKRSPRRPIALAE